MEDPVAGFSTRKQVIFAIVIVVSLLLLIEGAARSVLALSSRPETTLDVASGSIETQWFDVLAQDLRGEGASADLYVPDAELFWRLRPDSAALANNAVYKTRTRPVTWSIRINQDGYRGPAYPSAEVGASPVIVTLGDSCTFGFRVDEDASYPMQLEAFLHSHGLQRAAVVNYGVPGYTSFQGRRLLTQILARQRPAFVVLAYGANDLEADVASDAVKAERISPLRLRIYTALNQLGTARLLMREASRQRTDPARSTPTQRVSRVEYRENLLAMIRAARASGARVILLDFVLIGPVFRDTLAELARQEGLVKLDAREILKSGLDDLLAGRRLQAERAQIDRFWNQEVERYRLVYYDEAFYRKLFEDPVWRGLLRYLAVEPVHPSALGQRLIAEAVGRQILAERRP